MSESSLVMDALTLKKLYEFQLEGDLQPPVAPHVDQRETFCMLRVSRGMAPGVMREDEHAGIWIWSDLHLGHTETLHAFGRPSMRPGSGRPATPAGRRRARRSVQTMSASSRRTLTC